MELGEKTKLRGCFAKLSNLSEKLLFPFLKILILQEIEEGDAILACLGNTTLCRCFLHGYELFQGSCVCGGSVWKEPGCQGIVVEKQELGKCCGIEESWDQ